MMSLDLPALRAAAVGLRLLLVAGTLFVGLPGVGAADVRIDFLRTNGFIRALHGGNNGPLCSGETVDLTGFHRELAIPFTRLHDSAWPYPDMVDIHAVFPDFDADPALPGSYRFGPTDDYLRAITNTGARIVYRLGESIEHARRKRYVHPPADAAKWAEVCVGMIRHFNEGWAGGHHFGIRYWEIWNEPENRPAMWTGTDEDYYRLYVAASKAIKGRWPELRVGGPSLGHQGRFVDGRLEPSEFLKGFVAFVRREGAPLDFFSWHRYTTSGADLRVRARAVRDWLDGAGWVGTESHLNEWNYLPDDDWGPMLSKTGEVRDRWYARQGGAEGAAVVLSGLLELQDAPVDVANFYSADNQAFGLFSLHGSPKKTYFAFKAFRALLDAPRRVGVLDDGILSACAGVSLDGREAVLVLSDGREEQVPHRIRGEGWPWPGGAVAEVYLLDATRDLERVTEVRLPAGPWSLEVGWRGAGGALVLLKAEAAGRVEPGVREERGNGRERTPLGRR